MKRFVLTTGGTGGHIFPALAVAEELRKRFPDAEFLFVGGEYGPERDIVTRAGIEFVGLPVRGVLGRGLRAVGAVFGLAKATVRAMGIIGSFNPDAVIGFGGYAAFAACMGAKLREKPVAVHEQNSVPGLANKLLGKVADRIFISMPDPDEHFLPRKTVLTGNPVRANIRALRELPVNETGSRRLLVVGGSLGARAVNTAVMAMLPTLREAGVTVHHQTGQADLERVRAAYEEAGMQGCTVEAFIDDMATAYAQADLVLCRAGATTVAELTVAGKPAVFIPFPYATHNHQVHNARFLERQGAALVVEERQLAADSAESVDLPALVTALICDSGRLKMMAQASRKQGWPEAAANVASGLLDITRKAPLASLVHEYKK
ncbi:undecaprenyldiphospho-muramoylpentapeptide beta-N-acetylglucosaminyltransferase [Desulfovibrio mangrovi]|uniref:undecaprenyldiphospho-muramoylpentapeptide beta-N-acetylglucosaminyltransferase n=1 Tax=Desulfovibrio mangrovi TaxID=2976983 RepID=UPI002245775C|nr:undecaprenyldiphospho-muramoylpentapeptide beta-N-acetylglucosaminyltransferase [Desulfovibrio mangrovi]UZP67296.1 undecaprenyldiphospho-muramoylpentapeptide beta-N-acetylglucosaminyltransferase [Desulfovibrio mangrovi]